MRHVFASSITISSILFFWREKKIAVNEKVHHAVLEKQDSKHAKHGRGHGRTPRLQRYSGGPANNRVNLSDTIHWRRTTPLMLNF